MMRSKDWSVCRIEDSLMEASSSSGSSKRAKAPGNGNFTHVVSCLVDGCYSDLSLGREYHRRHKVCELHSKTPKVTIGGREQRFCQQCSRFHSLVEFDEGKRSCRKRLDGHNRRRRKPQAETQSINTGRFPSNQPGTTLLSFSGTQQLESAILNSTLAGAGAGTARAENGGGVVPYTSYQYFPGSLAQSFGGGNQFKILQGHDSHFSEASSSVSQLLLDPNSSASRMFSDRLSRVVESDCALSLLSSAPAETREIGLSNASMLYCNLSPFVGDNNANLFCQFQNGPDGSSSGSGSRETISFRWD